MVYILHEKLYAHYKYFSYKKYHIIFQFCIELYLIFMGVLLHCITTCENAVLARCSHVTRSHYRPLMAAEGGRTV